MNHIIVTSMHKMPPVTCSRCCLIWIVATGLSIRPTLEASTFESKDADMSRMEPDMAGAVTAANAGSRR